MARRWANTLTQADVTPEHLWLNRRQILAGAGATGAALLAGEASAEALEPNTWDEITNYNNYYEFGVGKDDPARNSGGLRTSPWSIEVNGLVELPGTYTIEDLIGGLDLEERIYRFRCVEAWSMVVPWNGVELNDVLDRVGVRPEARYIAFETVVQPDVMVGVRRRVMPFPYVEGLRLDEARHPLTLLATGIYGKPLANQSGAPIRLVVPWKYGFKSIKSIVRISLVADEPPASWPMLNPREYGFYSNVNPKVDHPRWTQATERKIGGGLFSSRVPTLMFNGYEEEVASLYDGMDLRIFY